MKRDDGLSWRGLGLVEKFSLILIAVWGVLFFSGIGQRYQTILGVAAVFMAVILLVKIGRMAMRNLIWSLRNRLIVADRNNNRIQVFDLEGKFIEEFRQFSRPSGVWVDKNDILYVSDSESESVSRNHDGWKRGIRWGSLRDGKILGFIPDPDEKATGTSAAEGVAVDAAGNIYGAEVGPKGIKKYVKK